MLFRSRRTETATERKRPRWLEFLVGPGRLADDYVQTHAQRVAEVMTPDPHTVAEDTPLEEIVQLMEKKHIKRVPVMRGKKLVGIISRANLLHALASMAPTATAQAPNDHAIRERLLAELEGEKWAPVGALDIIVRDGVVELWGSITDERERKALIVAAENIPGVKAVRDHLVWVDTMTDMVFNPPNEAKAS